MFNTMIRAVCAAGIFGLILGSYAPKADAAPNVQKRGAHYNCTNGPQLTVVFNNNNGQISANYVYDGPQTAMKVMLQSQFDESYFSNGRDSLQLRNRGKVVDYREGEDFQDRCTAFKFF